MKENSSAQAAKKAFLQLYRDGVFTPGSKIPSENDMAQRLNVSRMTWRKAVDLLQREGILVSRHGSGTYLLEQQPIITYDLSQLQSMSHMIDAAGLRESKSDVILSWETVSDEVQQFFEAGPKERYMTIQRVRYTDCGPISASISYLPEKYSDGITSEHPPKSIFDYMKQSYAISITKAMTELFVPQPEDPLYLLLQLQKGQSAFGLRQKHYSSRGLPVLYSLDYLRGDLFRFTILRTRG